jgi:hypothetical protein
MAERGRSPRSARRTSSRATRCSQAAAKTGLDAGIVGQIVEHIGGEGSLGSSRR